MKKFGRFIGVDVGTKRVGLARTDLLRTSANPVGTYPPDRVMDQIDDFLEDGPILAFVVGWPIATSGAETSSTRMAAAFIRRLEKRYPAIPVYRIDERYSSKQAVKALIESGVPRQKRKEKGRVDQAVAALLLQQFLETTHDFD